MVMDTLQIRLSPGLVKGLDGLVRTGLYANRADAIRDAVRRLIIDGFVGILPDTGNSVKEIRELRGNLSNEIKQFKDIESINKLAD